MRIGIPTKKIHEITRIDYWFLHQIEEMVVLEKEIEKYSIETIPTDLLLEIKMKGYADRQIAHLLKCLAIRKMRQNLGVVAVFKRIDTCAAEFEAQTPYMYSTYEAPAMGLTECEARPSSRKKVIILGGGPNRIGQGIEFDYCCCHACYSLTEQGYETIMINCNPETVCTDYDTLISYILNPFFGSIFTILFCTKSLLV